MRMFWGRVDKIALLIRKALERLLLTYRVSVRHLTMISIGGSITFDGEDGRVNSRLARNNHQWGECQAGCTMTIDRMSCALEE